MTDKKTQAEKEAELLERVQDGLYIGGQWRPASDGETLDVFDPATGEKLKTIADAAVEDGVAAVDAAAAAFPAWSATAPRTRADILRRAFDMVIERTEDFALLMTIEMGKPLEEARGEVTYGAEFLRWFSEEAVRIEGRYGPNPENTGRMIITKHPVGPAFLITPWNFPLAMATRKIAPALAAGTTVIVKPAALTPLTTIYLAQIFEEAGLPPGVLNVIATSRSVAVSADIIDHPDLRKLSFTGSTPVGQQLLKQAANGVLRTSMELGGNAPFIVFEDADLDAAVEGAMAAKFRNAGQTCVCTNRFLVQSSVVNAFCEKLAVAMHSELKVGDGTQAGINIGPLIDGNAVAKVSEHVQDAVDKGAELLMGGHPHPLGGNFFTPTLVSFATSSMKVAHEETFGPLAAVFPFDDEESAVEMANDTEYGLAAYFYSRDLGRVWRVADALEYGMVGINTGLISNAAAPFGGVKESGLGREGGHQGLDEFLETKYLCIDLG